MFIILHNYYTFEGRSSLRASLNGALILLSFPLIIDAY